jgi:hypothetical protein
VGCHFVTHFALLSESGPGREEGNQKLSLGSAGVCRVIIRNK